MHLCIASSPVTALLLYVNSIVKLTFFFFFHSFFYKYTLKKRKIKACVCNLHLITGFVHACVFFFCPPHTHTHTHTLALSAACRRGDGCWLLIVMVFVPLIYPAHGGYLARPDCVDGDTSILSSGEEVRWWIARNEGDLINRSCAQKKKKTVFHLPVLVSVLMEITQWLFFSAFL